ncbi:MAG TPA: response regulator [Planctomycetes bacterium]|nr:response regulator [Planctomycetota bacterium]
MPYTILVAEDDAEYGTFLNDLLESAGYTCTLFKDGISAYHALATGKYDAAVLDLALPNFSGIEVMRLVKEHGKKIPVLALTGHDAPEIQELVKEAGGAFLSKKAEPQAILKKLELLVERRRNE